MQSAEPKRSDRHIAQRHDCKPVGYRGQSDFIIDNGTRFYASAESGEQDGEAQRANVSATASHSLTISITNNENSFYNTLRENFEGAP